MEHEALHLNIFGNSHIFIKWMTSQNRIHNAQLVLFLEKGLYTYCSIGKCGDKAYIKGVKCLGG